MSLVEIEVAVAPPYAVTAGPGALDRLPLATASHARRAVLTDERVETLHAERLGELAAAPRLALEPGEQSKTLDGLEHVLDFMASAGLDRDSLLVTFGGGVVSDLGGLAASLWMRGIAVVHCPTTLLAQVDAAVGGKTAIDLPAGKNLAGTFHQPQAVLADTAVLATLDVTELRSGLGEVVKSALLGAPGLFALLEREAAGLLAREPGVLAQAVEACVRLKADIVAGDEREGGTRRALNLGHTFAHAIEHAAGYGRVPHGVAVAVGLVLALEASAELGLLEEGDLHARTRALLASLGLPSGLEELRGTCGAALGADQLIEAMHLDKKASAGAITLVLPRTLGRLELEARPGEELLAALLRRP